MRGNGEEVGGKRVEEGEGLRLMPSPLSLLPFGLPFCKSEGGPHMSLPGPRVRSQVYLRGGRKIVVWRDRLCFVRSLWRATGGVSATWPPKRSCVPGNDWPWRVPCARYTSSRDAPSCRRRARSWRRQARVHIGSRKQRGALARGISPSSDTFVCTRACRSLAEGGVLTCARAIRRVYGV